MIVDVSDNGKAVKNSPALFALALCSASEDMEVRQYALSKLPKVARIGTHLFQFTEYVEAFRGWGRALSRAIKNWYLEMPVDRLAYQVVKYQQREQWAHRDLLRLSHPKTDDHYKNWLFNWITHPEKQDEYVIELILDFEWIKKATDKKEVIRIIERGKLPWEAIPTVWLGDNEVWEALLPNLPLTALTRNLGRMTSNGLLKPLSTSSKFVVSKFSDRDYIHKSRLHPISILLALKTYASGHGVKGSLSWHPVSQIVDALDDAFYMAFDNVEATGKNYLFGVDVSGSMSMEISNMNLSSCEAAGALALAIAKTEPNYYIHGFAGQFVDLGISPKMRLDSVAQRMQDWNWGSTDCSLPMVYAKQHKLDVDTFIVITDNETYAGVAHPFQALNQYRQAMNKPNAKLIVLATTANNFSIADPADPLMLDLPGFSSDVPTVVNEFSRM
jgi:60 kDa SS-A/Ro ribonucleoprotein